MKKQLLLLLITLKSITVFSQVNEDMIMERFNMNAFNPAFVGIEGQVFSFNSRTKWQGIDNAPKTSYFAYNSNRKKNLALGASVISNKVFIDARTQYAIDASYQLKMEDEKHLYLGIKVGATSTNSNLDGLQRITNQANPFLTKTQNSIFPVFGAGALFKTNSYYFSASIPNILNPKNFVDENSMISSEKPIAYLLGGTSFNLETFDADIKPFISTKLNSNTQNITHLGVTLDFNDTFEVGGGYKTNGFSNLLLIYKTKFGLTIAYAYDFGATPDKQKTIKNRGSEIFLQYKLNSDKKISN